MLKDTDYQLVQLYVGENQLTEEKPAKGQQVVSINRQASQHLQKEQLNGKPRTKIDKTFNGFSTPKKRRRKKNRKNKGIRLKHRRQNGDN